jgi:hypothetical protein
MWALPARQVYNLCLTTECLPENFALPDHHQSFTKLPRSALHQFQNYRDTNLNGMVGAVNMRGSVQALVADECVGELEECVHRTDCIRTVIANYRQQLGQN